MIGARCRTADEYYSKNLFTWRKHRGRLGIIMGQTKSGQCWSILWDGNVSEQLSHKSHIEIVSDPVNLEQIATSLTELNNFYTSINEQKGRPS